MNSDEFSQIKKIFHAAIELGPGARPGFLDETCRDDKELRREVEKLLNSHETSFLEVPAIGGMAEAFFPPMTRAESVRYMQK